MPVLRAPTRSRPLCHSRSSTAGQLRGKIAVVLGSNNSRTTSPRPVGAGRRERDHDPALVVGVCTSDALMEHAWGKLYSQGGAGAGITTEIADLTVASMPFKAAARADEAGLRTSAGATRSSTKGWRRRFLFDFARTARASTHLPAARAGYYIDVGPRS